MSMEARMFFKPCLDIGRFVRPVVIDNQVQCLALGKRAVQVAQEFEKLPVSMSFITFPDHCPVQYVERGE